MFQDGSVKAISSASKAWCVPPRWCPPESPRHCTQSRRAPTDRATLAKNTLLASVQPAVGAARPPEGPPSHRLPQDSKPMLTRSHPKCTAGVPTADCDGPTANFNRFPCNGFTYCLTLFSKCFSSFPHGTCSLSVSCQYLALDEIYHPKVLGCIPKQPDSSKTPRTGRVGARLRGSHPLWRPVPRNLARPPHQRHF